MEKSTSTRSRHLDQFWLLQTSNGVTSWSYSLYPLNQGTHVVSKALLPIGNVPVINLVLDWVLESGLRGILIYPSTGEGSYWYPDILLIVPPAYYTPISNHITQSYSLISHPKARIQIKRYTDGEDDEDDEAGMHSEGTARLLKRFRSYIKVSLSFGLSGFLSTGEKKLMTSLISFSYLVISPHPNRWN